MLNLIFGFKGRIGRGTFWMIFAGLVVSTFLMLMWCGSTMMSVLTTNSRGEVQPNGAAYGLKIVLGTCFMIGVALSSFAAYVKRLHDRDKSGWWLMAYIIPAFLGKFIPEALMIAGLVQLWFFVELGFLSGTNGPNRFDGGSVSLKEFDDPKGPFAKRTPTPSASPAMGRNAAPQAFAQPPRTFNATPGGGGFGRRGL